MSLSVVSVVLIEPVAVFEFGVAVEVFGLDRTEDGVPSFDFRVCSVNPGVPLQTKNVSPFTITATHGLAVSKPAISRHVRVLEDAGGVVRTSCDCGGPPDPAGTRPSPRSRPGSVAGCGW